MPDLIILLPTIVLVLVFLLVWPLFLIGSRRPWSRFRRALWMTWVVGDTLVLITGALVFAMMYFGPGITGR